MLLQTTNTWPLKAAMASFEKTLDQVNTLIDMNPNPFIIDFVMCHCAETELEWIGKSLAPHLVDVIPRLWIYEKCGNQADVSEYAEYFTGGIYHVPTPDPSFVARGDECSAYLKHITTQYDKLADYTFFIHSDPGEHLHFSFMQTVVKSMAMRTYNQEFLHLNGPRHVRTLTPCIQAIAEVVFEEKFEQVVGPYCCAQFVVSRNRIRSRDEFFYHRMLMMVNGTLPYDLCTTSTVARSTHCYGMEFLWHVVWGEDGDPPLRQDDKNLPISFRLKYGVEHDKNDWNDVTLSPNVPKKIVFKKVFE